LYYLFIAPNVTPRSKCFLIRKVNIATGSKNINVAAAICPQSTPPEATALGIPGGAVIAAPPYSVNTKAKTNSFHAVIKQNTLVAAIPVVA
jgi:hypothetical protein